MNEQSKKTLGFFLEIFPLAAFFIGNKFAHHVFNNDPEKNLIYATGILMVATVFSLGTKWMMDRKLAIMPLITLVIILIFGGLTIYLDNKFFIKIKPTILNLCFASVLLGGLLFKKSLISYVMGPVLDMDDKGWVKLSLYWGLFFIFLAGLNEVVWRNYSEDAWVNFKVFGMMPITLAFSLLSIFLVSKHLIPDEDDEQKKIK